MDTSREFPIADRLYLDLWRRRRNLTQRELAEKSGVALTTINEIETGKRKPRPATLRRLAAVIGTAEWNLYNQPGEAWTAVPEVAEILKRLGQVASDMSQTGDGERLAYEVFRYHEDMNINVDQMVDDAEESIVLLISFLLLGRTWLTKEMDPTAAREFAEITSPAIPYRVREWVDRHVPQDVAEALLKAEAKAVKRGAAIANSDVNGSHDLIIT